MDDLELENIFKQEAHKQAEILSNAERLENHYMYYDLIDMFMLGAKYGYNCAINKIKK